MSLEQLRILIAMDHELFSRGLAHLFKNKGGRPLCDIINCSEHLIDEGIPDIPDIALIDLSSPHINGEGAIRKILRSFPGARVNVLSLYVDDVVKEQLKEAGIRGYLERHSKASQFVDSLKMLISGDEYFGENYKNVINRRIKFSERELQVLRLIAQGYTDTEIAGILYIETNTVSWYRRNLLIKFRARNTAELVAISIREGYISF